jgi:hypothetical protein
MMMSGGVPVLSLLWGRAREAEGKRKAKVVTRKRRALPAAAVAVMLGRLWKVKVVLVVRSKVRGVGKGGGKMCRHGRVLLRGKRGGEMCGQSRVV